METHNATKGKAYLITAKTTTIVTDAASGYVLATVPADTQRCVIAISDTFTTLGECIVSPFV